MPNVGGRSTGCANCRKRRVKCDENRPQCHRCLKLGKFCPGYKRDLEIKLYTNPGKKRASPHQSSKQPEHLNEKSFRLENRSLKPDLGVSILSNVVAKEIPPVKRLQTSSKGLEQNDVSHLHCALSVDLDSQSLGLFVASFVLPTERKYDHPLFLDFIPEMYMGLNPASCLQQALTAVARLNFVNRYNAVTLSNWATACYSKALSTTNHALSQDKMAYTDEALATVWLLSFYEVLLPNTELHNQPKPTPWRSHICGSLELLLRRGIGQLSTRRGRQMFILVHTTTLIMTMVAGKRPSESLHQLINDFLETNPRECKGEFLVTQYLQNVGTVRAVLRELPHSIGWTKRLEQISPSLPEVLEQATTNHERTNFEAWIQQEPEWKPIAVGKEVRSAVSEPRFCVHHFASTFIMSNWATYWTSRLLLMQSVLKSDFTSEITDSKTQQSAHDEILARLIKAADDILGLIGFAFNEISISGEHHHTALRESGVYADSAVGAVHIFWPLGAILSSEYTTLEQKTLAREALRSVGGRFRVAQALKYVEA